jgi:hypothetical protein
MTIKTTGVPVAACTIEQTSSTTDKPAVLRGTHAGNQVPVGVFCNMIVVNYGFGDVVEEVLLHFRWSPWDSIVGALLFIDQPEPTAAQSVAGCTCSTHDQDSV